MVMLAPERTTPDPKTQLLAWFAANGRDLPWRRTRDPYRVMVSEIMLQQTQVDRVIPKYHAFLEAFPTLEALAAAPTADVIRAWAGLGYNRRAVNMQRTARVVLSEYQGRFPHDIATLLRLPGIGRYTAGAIACFAFEQDVAFLDTNIRRVIRRLFFAPSEEPTEATLLERATAAVPPNDSWAWNQAIMELGALICTAANPACWRCPLQYSCRDYAERRDADQQLFEPTAAPATRRIAERRTASYGNSNRYYRGRVVDALRQLPPGATMTLAALGQHLKPDDDTVDQEWLVTLVAGLHRDGLITFDGATARLPD